MNQISTVLNELEDDVINYPIDYAASKLGTSRDNIVTESRVYIQQKGIFLESTPEKLTDTLRRNGHQTGSSSWNHLPSSQQIIIDSAIQFQRKSHIVGNLCYGLLGGISLMQLVLTHALIKGSKHELIAFIELYSKFGYVPSASFSILTTICLVFAFDCIDLVTIKEQMKMGDRTAISNWIILVLYFSMFVLSVLCFKFDQIIAMYPESKNEILASGDLWVWKTFNLWKCIFGIIGWFVICIQRPQDFLEIHLCSLRKMSTEKNQNSRE